MRKLAFLLLPEFSHLGLAAAIEPLFIANWLAQERVFDWTLLSVDGKAVRASNGMATSVDGDLAAAPAAQTVFVLASFEPAHVDELAIMLRHALEFMQKPDGSAVWLRLSTRALAQPERTIDPAEVIAGAHWIVRPAAGARIALAYQGPVATEVMEAFEVVAAETEGAGLLAITSPDRLYAGWLEALRARRQGDRGTRSHA